MTSERVEVHCSPAHMAARTSGRSCCGQHPTLARAKHACSAALELPVAALDVSAWLSVVQASVLRSRFVSWNLRGFPAWSCLLPLMWSRKMCFVRKKRNDLTISLLSTGAQKAAKALHDLPFRSRPAMSSGVWHFPKRIKCLHWLVQPVRFLRFLDLFSWFGLVVASTQPPKVRLLADRKKSRKLRPHLFHGRTRAD